MSTKKNNTPARKQKRRRCLPATYEYANQIEQLMADEKTPATVRDAITDALFEFAACVRVSLASPAIVRAAFLEMRRAVGELNEQQGHYSYDTYRAVHWLFRALDAVKEGATLAEYDGQSNDLAALFGTPGHADLNEAGEETNVRYPKTGEQIRLERELGLEPTPGRRTPTDANADSQLRELRERLSRLEFLPENEACRFQLLAEIHRLEQQTSDEAEEWPEVIGDE